MLATDNAIDRIDSVRRGSTKGNTMQALIKLIDQIKIQPTVTRRDFSYDSLKEHFIQVVNRETANLRDDSMSGFPSAYIYQTKGKEIADTTILWFMYYSCINQLLEIVQINKFDNYESQMFSISNLYAAYFLIIQKNEAHDEKKISQGRYRTLQVCNTISYIFSDYLYGETHDPTSWQSTYCAAGMDASTTIKRDAIRNKILSWKGKMRTSSDITGYEWSTQEIDWILWTLEKAWKLGKISVSQLKSMQEMNIKGLRMFLEHNDDLWFRCAWANCCKNGNSHVIYEDGSVMSLMLSDNTPLLWRNPSGHKGTADFGSSSRAMLEIQIGLDNGFDDVECITMGDDCVSTLPKEILEREAHKYGRIVKDVIQSEVIVEFCGYEHNLRDRTDRFLRVNKTLAAFACGPKTPEQWQGMYNVLKDEVNVMEIPTCPFSPAQSTSVEMPSNM